MHRARAAAPRGLDQPVGVEVGLRGIGRAEQHRFVGLVHERQVLVCLAVDRHRADIEPAQRPDYPTGDLTAPGHQNRLEHAWTL